MRLSTLARVALGLTSIVAVLGLPRAAGAQAAPQRGRPLAAFSVLAPDGREVPGTGMSSEPRWLLVYVKPGAVATDRLIAALGRWDLPADALKRLVLIVEGPVEQASEYLAPRLTADVAFRWYADPGGRAARALGFAEAPAFQGVAGGEVSWTLTGVLGDPDAYESVVRAGIGAPAAAR